MSEIYNKGLLIVISGPSGAGKGTVCKELMKKYNYNISISATTRSPREGEVDGVNYHFLDKKSFEEKLSRDEFLEYAQVYGNYYGTLKKGVEDELNKGNNIILEIDIQGTLQVQKVYKNAVYIFLLPPSINELKNRILKRGSETESSFNLRFSSVGEELKYMNSYDYAVINDDLDSAVEKVHSIINTEMNRISRMNLDKFLEEYIF
ncbi:guanylate kinase [Candidatus Arthromitus sp. SFB-turkey]|uniref:guanylate kinase n=1 Tax=Candidatus Arthromitus sp. SFB-turkey TaxID=1840217 RepID=UPI0007F40495|nr:guanylate kinase [Candidatus Arthromitus sp. SFB-turkey]OAT89702.1 guanylate kinase [Candidatus Arthromitus sp. SFB-turkey]